jgi:hypothetical protein
MCGEYHVCPLIWERHKLQERIGWCAAIKPYQSRPAIPVLPLLSGYSRWFPAGVAGMALVANG